MGARTRADDRWFHVDATHSAFAVLVNRAVARHSIREPEAVLSVNMKIDGTEALVKVRGAHDWQISSPAIFRVFDAFDHHEAIALVRAVEWEPPEPEDIS